MITPSQFTYRAVSRLDDRRTLYSATNDGFTDIIFDYLLEPQPEPPPPAPSRERYKRPYYDHSFSVWFRNKWRRSRLSYRELGRLLGVNKSTVASLVNGKHRPTEDTVRRIAALYGRRFDDLWQMRNL